MKKVEHFIGVDVSSESLAACLWGSNEVREIANDWDGYHVLLSWLAERDVVPSKAVVCMEATGVYTEHFCHYLASKGFLVAVEPPHKVKRAFEQTHRKNDALDSTQIAEYAHRYCDRLTIWEPSESIVEQVKVLLTTREQFTQQKTSNRNALNAFSRKYFKTPLAEKALQKTIEHLATQIKEVDKEIRRLIGDHPSAPTSQVLMSVPAVGLLMTSNLFALTNGFSVPLNHRRIASYLGICPHEYESGKTVHKRPRSRKFGPARMRKLLYLASMVSVQRNHVLRHYFLRKVGEGKPKKLVLNNVANKLLRILCAIISSERPFIANYRSVHPVLLQKA